jgi:hypothetical protein
MQADGSVCCRGSGGRVVPLNYSLGCGGEAARTVCAPPARVWDRDSAADPGSRFGIRRDPFDLCGAQVNACIEFLSFHLLLGPRCRRISKRTSHRHAGNASSAD